MIDFYETSLGKQTVEVVAIAEKTVVENRRWVNVDVLEYNYVETVIVNTNMCAVVGIRTCVYKNGFFNDVCGADGKLCRKL